MTLGADTALLPSHRGTIEWNIPSGDLASNPMGAKGARSVGKMSI